MVLSSHAIDAGDDLVYNKKIRFRDTDNRFRKARQVPAGNQARRLPMKNTALFYMYYTAPYPGNFLASMIMLAGRLKERGITSHFIFPEQAEGCCWRQMLADAEIAVSFLPESPARQLSFWRMLLRQKNILFLHLHFTDNMSERLMMKAAMVLCHNKIPLVVHYHNHYSSHARGLKLVLKKLIIHGDHLLGCSAGVVDSLKSSGLHNDIDFIENAIAFDRLKSVRTGYEQHNFLQFGFDYERKGVDLSLEAFCLLRKKYPDLSLSISLSSNREAVEKKITEKFGKIPGWIRLLPPTEDIYRYYDQACAFLSPSREEGFCYSVVEAAYCKCPVIASDISGQNGISIPEIIWCKSENPSDLAEKIDAFLCMPGEEKRKLGESLKSSAIRCYDVKRWAAQMTAYYEKRGLLIAK